jgi:hypothetical protein
MHADIDALAIDAFAAYTRLRAAGAELSAAAADPVPA